MIEAKIGQDNMYTCVMENVNVYYVLYFSMYNVCVIYVCVT